MRKCFKDVRCGDFIYSITCNSFNSSNYYRFQIMRIIRLVDTNDHIQLYLHPRNNYENTYSIVISKAKYANETIAMGSYVSDPKTFIEAYVALVSDFKKSLYSIKSSWARNNMISAFYYGNQLIMNKFNYPHFNDLDDSGFANGLNVMLSKHNISIYGDGRLIYQKNTTPTR